MSQNFKSEFQQSLSELGRYFMPSQPVQGMTRVLSLGAVGVGLAGAFYVRHFNPTTQGIFPPCPFFLITGCHCPGCGLTRGFHQLLNGNIIGALDYNILILFWAPFLSYVGISLLLTGIRGRGLPRAMPPNFLIWTFVVVMITFWIARNLPVYPFNWLAP